jgi:hypothetical protein
MRIDPFAQTIEVLNLHVTPKTLALDAETLADRQQAVHNGLAINTFVGTGESPLVNGDFSNGLTGWSTVGTPTVSAGALTLEKASGVRDTVYQALTPNLGSNVAVTVKVNSVAPGCIFAFLFDAAAFVFKPFYAPGVYTFSPLSLGADLPYNGIALLAPENIDGNGVIDYVTIAISDGAQVTQIEAKGNPANAGQEFGTAGYGDILTISSLNQDYSDLKEIAVSERLTLGSIGSGDLRGAVDQILTITPTLPTKINFFGLAASDSGLNLAAHIQVGEEEGTPDYGMIRYTGANAFEGYYEVSPGVGEWKSFRTEEANLPASSPGYTIRYEDGHWKATALVQVHDSHIALGRDTLVEGAIRLADVNEDHDSLIGMVRYNGDFQGYMELIDHEDNLSGFWVSLTGGGIASGGNDGEMLVYSAENQKWVSALDKILYLENQLTIQGRFSPKVGLTIPVANRLPGDTYAGDYALQSWLADHPLEWVEGTYPTAAPDGNWIRVLVANGTDRMQDKVQVWGIIGYETFSHEVEPGETESESVPKYGWLNLAATDESGNGLTLPNPAGHEGEMLIVRSNLYTFISDISIPVDEDEPITISRGLVAEGDVVCENLVTGVASLSSDLRLTEEDKYIGIGEYDEDRTGTKHPEDWMWQITRKEPTAETIEYYPGDEAEGGGVVPLRGYGSDSWDAKDLVLQYHMTARETPPTALVDSFESGLVKINGAIYTITEPVASYLPTYSITLSSELSATLADDSVVASATGVFAKTFGSHASGSAQIVVERVAATTIPAFTDIEVRIGDVTYNMSTVGGNPAVLVISNPGDYPVDTQSPLLTDTILYGPTGAFAKTSGAHGNHVTMLTVVPYTPAIAPAFTNKSITLAAVSKLGSTDGSQFNTTVTATITPGLVANAYAGDVVYVDDEPIAALNANYIVGDDDLVLKAYYAPVEALRLTRGGNALIGRDLRVARNLFLNGPAILGEFDEDTNDLQVGMIHYNGDFEGYNGSHWVSLTRRLAQPQIPMPVLNQPTRCYKAGVLIGNVTTYAVAEQVTLSSATGLAEDDLIEFDNGVAAIITGVASLVVSLDRDVRAGVYIDDTLHYCLSSSGSTLNLATNVTVTAGTIVYFTNGAKARVIEDVTADNNLPLDTTIDQFGKNVSINAVNYYCRRYNGNRLYLNTSPALSQGQVLILGEHSVKVLQNYPSSIALCEIEVQPAEVVGATLRYDDSQGWTYTDSMLVNNEQVYLKEGLVLGSPTSSAPTAGMVRWAGDFEGYNGSVWQSLTGNGDQDIAPSDLGNMLVMGETIWQPSSDVTFLQHSGPGSAGVLRINNVLKLAEWIEDEMDPSEFERGMLRHRGDLEYYTGNGWISVTDYYGLPGGHLPLPGEDAFVAGMTVKYVAPGEGSPNGLWVETDTLLILDDGVAIEGNVSCDTLSLVSIPTGDINDEPNSEGTIKYHSLDFYGKTSTGWRSLTSRLGISPGVLYDTLYLHCYADDELRTGGTPDTINREWLATNRFQMKINYAAGQDPPDDDPESVEAVFDCTLEAKDYLQIKKEYPDPDTTHFWRFTATNEGLTKGLSLQLFDEAGDPDLTGIWIFNSTRLRGIDIDLLGNLTAHSVTLEDALSADSLQIAGASLLQDVQTSGRIISNYSPNTGGEIGLEIGVQLDPSANHTQDTFVCHGLAVFDDTIQIGDSHSESPVPGQLRYHSDDFQGWDGQYWYSLTGKDALGALFGESERGAIITYDPDTESWAPDTSFRHAVVGGFSITQTMAESFAGDMDMTPDQSYIAQIVEEHSNEIRLWVDSDGTGFGDNRLSFYVDGSLFWTVGQVDPSNNDIVFESADATVPEVLRLQQQDGAVALSNYYLTPWTGIPIVTGRRHSTHFEGSNPVVLFQDTLGFEEVTMGFNFNLTNNTVTTFQTFLDVPEDATYIDLRIHCGNDGWQSIVGDNIGFTGRLAAAFSSFANDSGEWQQISSVLHSSENGGSRLYSDHNIVTLRVTAADFIDPDYFPRGKCAITFTLKRDNSVADNYANIVSVWQLAIAAGR